MLCTLIVSNFKLVHSTPLAKLQVFPISYFLSQICSLLVQNCIRKVSSDYGTTWIVWIFCLQVSSAKQICPLILNLSSLRFSGYGQNTVWFFENMIWIATRFIPKWVWNPSKTTWEPFLLSGFLLALCLVLIGHQNGQLSSVYSIPRLF